MDARLLIPVSLVGTVAMLASLIEYILEPAQIWIYVFAAGLVLLVAGYALSARLNRSVLKESEAASAEEPLQETADGSEEGEAEESADVSEDEPASEEDAKEEE